MRKMQPLDGMNALFQYLRQFYYFYNGLDLTNRLRAMDETDHRRRAREEARNNLESFVYNVQDLLSDQIVIKVSTEKQRKELTVKSTETSEWLYEEGEEAPIESLRMRLDSLRFDNQSIHLLKF